jgi:hypothetical protein
MDMWIIINAVMGWLVGLYVFQFAIRHANGKKPIRLISSAVIMYFAFVYTRAWLGYIPVPDIAVALRPWVSIAVYFLPLWECRIDSHQGA